MKTAIEPEGTKVHYLLILYVILSVVNIGMEYWHIKWGIFLTKPLLLTLLSFYFYLSIRSNPSSFSKFLLGGLIFSIFGDSFLMFVEYNPDVPQFFIYGLGSFLMAHLFYLLAFAKIPQALTSGFLMKNKGLFVFFMLYLLGNVLFLWSAIPVELKIPVIIYIVAIISMTTMGANLKGLISRQVYNGLILGILLFVVSDSLIAINKFHPHAWQIPYARVLIMVTYLMAQYFIATRSVKIARQNLG